MHSTHYKPTQGFTLIEVVIVIVLSGILASAAVQPLIQAFTARARVANNLDAIDGLRYATERIVREMRQTQYDTAGTGFQLKALDYASSSGNASNGICFKRSGGSTGTSTANIALRKSGTLLTLDQGVSYPACNAVQANTLAANVSNLLFTFWSYGSTSTPVALAVGNANFGQLLSFIDITLTITPAGNAGVTPVTLQSRVVLRNGAWGAAK